MTRLDAAVGVLAAGMTATVAAGLFAAAAASAGTVGGQVGEFRPPAAVVAVAPVEGARPVLLARRAPSPCQASTARYRAAQEALTAGDIDAADDLAVIAAALIEQCGWTRVDTALGART